LSYTITWFVCANGRGHLERTLALSRYIKLIQPSTTFLYVCSNTHSSILRKSGNTLIFPFSDERIPPDPLSDFISHLLDVASSSNCILTDNLGWPLFLLPNTKKVFVSSFAWEHVLPSIFTSSQIHTFEESLSMPETLVVSSRFFCHPSLTQHSTNIFYHNPMAYYDNHKSSIPFPKIAPTNASYLASPPIAVCAGFSSTLMLQYVLNQINLIKKLRPDILWNFAYGDEFTGYVPSHYIIPSLGKGIYDCTYLVLPKLGILNTLISNNRVIVSFTAGINDDELLHNHRSLRHYQLACTPDSLNSLIYDLLITHSLPISFTENNGISQSANAIICHML